jgi:hypothetical protein
MGEHNNLKYHVIRFLETFLIIRLKRILLILDREWKISIKKLEIYTVQDDEIITFKRFLLILKINMTL